MNSASLPNRRRSIARLLSISDSSNGLDSVSRELWRSRELSVLCEILKNQGIDDATALLQMSTVDIMVRCDFSLEEVYYVIESLSKNIAHGKYLGRASDLYRTYNEKVKENTRYISTGSKLFDSILRGGLPMGSIVEVCGPPGIGKTQFCMTICAQALKRSQQRGLNFGVVYFDTELKFNATRLAGILLSGTESFSLSQALSATEVPYSQLKLLIKRPTTCKALLEEVESLQSTILSDGIVLVVVDSIASLARREALNEIDKEKYVVRQAATLKRIAELCNCLVLAANQVTPDVSVNDINQTRRGDALNDTFRDEGDIDLKPALGPTWHHCVSSRFTLTTRRREVTEISGGIYQPMDSLEHNTVQRLVSLTKSPHLPSFTKEYTITAQGFNIL